MDVPDIEIVGVEVIPSLKAAVMVTVSDAAKRLSSSVSEKVTDGGVLSNVITILSLPAYVFPARSLPVTVTV
jgi:hypothetical protein